MYVAIYLLFILKFLPLICPRTYFIKIIRQRLFLKLWNVDETAAG